MKAGLRILHKGFIAEYYRQNLFFILLVLLFAFGFLSGAEHRQLAEIAAKSKTFLGYILLIWLVYAAFNMHFAWRTLTKKEFYVFFNISQFSTFKSYFLLVYTYFMCSPLSVYYGLFMIGMGFYGGFVFMPIIVFTFHVLVTLIGGAVFYYRISISQERKQVLGLRLQLFRNLKLPFYMFFIREAVQTRPVMLILVKMLSIFIILGFIHLYPTDAYDIRLFSMMAVFLGFVNYPIIQEYLIFENEKLSFQRTLAITWLSQFCLMLLTSFLILMPEIVFFAFRGHLFVSPLYSFYWSIFVLVIFMAIKAAFYLPFNEERIQKSLFWIFISLQILIMYKTPLVFLIGCLGCFSLFSISKYYRNWEPGKDLFLQK